MANLNGFWSYVHKDDEAEGGRISQLARDLTNQFEMLTGETISLFLDKEKIDWGENWKNKIDTSLTNVGFFVPVLTPRYFLSPECRRELSLFANLATQTGLQGLILPILYIDIAGMHDENSQDELIQLVKKFQWVDWQDLRFLGVDSEGYRRGVANLAASLAEANKKAEETSSIALPQENNLPVESSDDELGVIEIMADFQEKLHKSPETLIQINAEISEIGKLMNEATADITKHVSPNLVFANRLAVSKRLAHQLEEPIEKIWVLNNELSLQMRSIDKGYRVIVEYAPMAIENEPNYKQSFCGLMAVIRDFKISWDKALNSTQTFIESTEPLDKLSRDLRPVMRRLRQGLTIMMELKGLSQEWIDLFEASGIDCEGITKQN